MISRRSFGLLFCIFLPGRDHPFHFSPIHSRTPRPATLTQNSSPGRSGCRGGRWGLVVLSLCLGLAGEVAGFVIGCGLYHLSVV